MTEYLPLLAALIVAGGGYALFRWGPALLEQKPQTASPTPAQDARPEPLAIPSSLAIPSDIEAFAALKVVVARLESVGDTEGAKAVSAVASSLLRSPAHE